MESTSTPGTCDRRLARGTKYTVEIKSDGARGCTIAPGNPKMLTVES